MNRIESKARTIYLGPSLFRSLFHEPPESVQPHEVDIGILMLEGLILATDSKRRRALQRFRYKSRHACVWYVWGVSVVQCKWPC